MASSDAEAEPDLRFFLDLRRSHFPPYYSIPGIHTSAQPNSDENPQPKEVLVLGIRSVAAPTREERPELAHRPASVDGGDNQSSTGMEETASSENDEDVDEEEGSDRDRRISDRFWLVTFSEAVYST
ncbi:hypothetical protein B0H10DRAFT_1957176 [Mycena sp. CBHHK59/15]|nr:hypothetical protein B0H10DRAFT_1957176 [Mycena sp. CBHHK59/15]